ncbi:Flagellar biosynthesis protein FliQ [hydrothermal vent metagenome]|uniref:Flagellar biosynthetic protein FliQ n=1 Tax=hydrothermal vent metagenome TaxID=652676 RepID=A0A3B1D2L6_9ZZZZ|nr:flagellar biosynthesis protein FliQ [Candidatus Manganitrophaceae bacterium]
MTPEFVTQIVQRTIEISVLLSAPVLVSSLAIGLVVSLFQAVTQINEATLTFLPKILVAGLALAFFFPWMLSVIVGFTSDILMNFPTYTG